MVDFTNGHRPNQLPAKPKLSVLNQYSCIDFSRVESVVAYEEVCRIAITMYSGDQIQMSYGTLGEMNESFVSIVSAVNEFNLANRRFQPNNQ